MELAGPEQICRKSLPNNDLLAANFGVAWGCGAFYKKLPYLRRVGVAKSFVGRVEAGHSLGEKLTRASPRVGIWVRLSG